MKQTKVGISLQTSEGPERVEVLGYVVNEYLAVHRDAAFNTWVLTHLPTGQALISDLSTRKQALARAKAVLRCGVSLDFTFEQFQAMPDGDRTTLKNAASSWVG